MMPTSADYKRAADMNLWAAKMMRLKGDEQAATAHFNLADLYIKQELRRDRRERRLHRAACRGCGGPLPHPRPGRLRTGTSVPCRRTAAR